MLIAQQVDVGDGETVTRLVYDPDGGLCSVDESELPMQTPWEDVFDLFRTQFAASFPQIIEEPFFEPDGPPRHRWVFGPVTLSPNQQFFGLIGWIVPEAEAVAKNWPNGMLEDDLRNKQMADYEVEIDGVAFKGSNLPVMGPLTVELAPEVNGFITAYDYAQIIRTPGQHSVIYRLNHTETIGECPQCFTPGIRSFEFTINIVPEGGEGGMAAQAPAPFSEATDMGDGWWASDWFGTFRDQPDDWIHHSEHGPLFIPGPGESDGFWAFDLDTEEWITDE